MRKYECKYKVLFLKWKFTGFLRFELCQHADRNSLLFLKILSKTFLFIFFFLGDVRICKKQLRSQVIRRFTEDWVVLLMQHHFLQTCLSCLHSQKKLRWNIIKHVFTLTELIFVGIKFRDFREFWLILLILVSRSIFYENINLQISRNIVLVKIKKFWIAEIKFLFSLVNAFF